MCVEVYKIEKSRECERENEKRMRVSTREQTIKQMGENINESFS